MQMVISSKRCPVLCVTALLANLLAVPCGRSGGLSHQGWQTEGGYHPQNWRQGFPGAPGRGVDYQAVGRLGLGTQRLQGPKLSAKQLAALAQHLATQDFNSLPSLQGYDPNGASSYRYIVIAFGKKAAAFNIQQGESRADYLPKPGDPRAAAWSRFIALELVLADLLDMAEVRAGYGIKSGRDRAK